MTRLDGALARPLDFEQVETVALGERRDSTPLRLAAAQSPVRGREKYKVLEHRRRQAQIKARRLLDLLG